MVPAGAQKGVHPGDTLGVIGEIVRPGAHGQLHHLQQSGGGPLRHGGTGGVVDHGGQAHTALQVYGHPEGLRRAPEHPLQRGGEHLLQRRVLVPDGAGQLGLAGQDIGGGTGVEGAHRDDHKVPGAHLPADHRLEGGYHGAGRRDDVDPLVGSGAVAALAPDGQGEEAAAAHAHPGLHADRAAGQVRGHVDGKDCVHAVQYPGLQQGTARPGELLRRLKHQPHPAGQGLPLLPQQGGGPQQHGGVGVVAAGVHHAGDLGGKGQAGGLLDGQGVHVRPQQHRGAGMAAENLGHHTGVPHRAEGDGPGGQLLSYPAAGLKLLESQLGPLVEGAAQAHHIISEHLFFHAAPHLMILGSRALRSTSPSTLKLSTVIRIKSPGNTASSGL